MGRGPIGGRDVFRLGTPIFNVDSIKNDGYRDKQKNRRLA
jgi:hypothetical protein